MSKTDYSRVLYSVCCLDLLIAAFGDGSGLLKTVDPVSVVTVMESCRKELQNVIMGE